MAIVPTLLAIGIGVGLGLYWGGRLSNLWEWVPPLWEALVGGVVLTVLVDLVPWSGPVMTFLSIVATAALLGFAVVNVRIGGMVLVVAGLGLNLLVTVLNWGMPVSTSALVSAKISEAITINEAVGFLDSKERATLIATPHLLESLAYKPLAGDAKAG